MHLKPFTTHFKNHLHYVFSNLALAYELYKEKKYMIHSLNIQINRISVPDNIYIFTFLSQINETAIYILKLLNYNHLNKTTNTKF